MYNEAISKKEKNKNETFCMRIVKFLSGMKKEPIEINCNSDSFKLVYNYAKGLLTVQGMDIDIHKTKKVEFFYSPNDSDRMNWSILSKSNCTFKNAIEILNVIFKIDHLPRCHKCCSRPEAYHEYKYGSEEINTDYNFLPVLNTFNLFDINVNDGKKAEFVIAECCCGNQWRLYNFTSILEIYDAYKEGYK